MRNKRIRLIQEGVDGEGPVIYWMNRDQRADDNWALLLSQDFAIRHKRKFFVVFCFTPIYLQASYRAYHFMLSNFKEVESKLSLLNIPFILLEGEASSALPQFIHKSKASTLFTDFNPLRIKKEWLDQLKRNINIPIYEVDAHNIVPCWEASPKKEYSAHTFRPKILKKIADFLISFPPLKFHPFNEDSISSKISPESLLRKYKYLKQEIPKFLQKPGYVSGMEQLQRFIHTKLHLYNEYRNDPTKDCLSDLSPFLHFGQISSQRVALTINEYAKNNNKVKAQSDIFLEELIIRKELADNFCFYTPDYDSLNGLPDWGQKTLNEHREDKREFLYSLENLEKSNTHDPLWNACQKDMIFYGKLHGWLRMYWAKKILEWSRSPEEALKNAIYLNDAYEIDGRDPNGYTGIAWSIGGLHDRPWPERKVFGKVRYMNYKGAERKFHVKQYIDEIIATAINDQH
ncbi:deoxyribodipyrimidine photo-lyase [Aminobacterium sp. MB27-C1]|uniref:deoxyribodipyrimidine photo-lyase n=1 Tax=Aminobacterium sp. MB27-C1 TaxID=3070661 RepID=UPI0027DAF50A|nr:deoxyribodipyrimidine photo-lyase [Aminobacterium sp. MB27-C1]WMI71459.1 deoxyribodipyrimidine photo-lyase [Aminobacterium sp. MB27-C1]